MLDSSLLMQAGELGQGHRLQPPFRGGRMIENTASSAVTILVTSEALAEQFEDAREALDSLPVGEVMERRRDHALVRLSNDQYVLVGPEVDEPWDELAWVVPALPGEAGEWDFIHEVRGSVLLTHFMRHGA